MNARIGGLVVVTLLGLPFVAFGREWTDDTGKHKQEADLVDFDNQLVVLKKGNGQLVAVPLERLSKDDLAFLKSKEAKTEIDAGKSKDRKWTLKTGQEIVGRVAKYGVRKVVLDRRNGKFTINDKPYAELSDFHKTVLPLLVSYFEKREYKDEKAVEAMVAARRGVPLEYEVQGVLLEVSDGEMFAVPLLMFSDKDAKVLKPGWEAWVAAGKDEAKRQQQDLMAQSMANEYQKNKDIDHQIQLLQLASDWFDLWQVELIAPNGQSTTIVVPARNSAQAQAVAHMRVPQAQIGATARLQRRN